MVQPDGEIVYGGFIDPVELSAMEEEGFDANSRRVLGSTACRFFNGGELSRYFNDKAVAKEMFKQADLPYCPSVACYNDGQIIDVDNFLDHAEIQENGTVVVKPCHGQCGVAVSFCPVGERGLILSKIQQIHEKGDGALVEQFIKPFQMIDEDDSKKVLVANIRAASIGSMSPSSLRELMFARVGKADGPVNVFRGAKTKSIEWLLAKADENGLDSAKIVDEIIKHQMSIRSTGVETFGADYVIDNEGKVHLLEVNTVYFGATPFIDKGNPMSLPDRIAKAGKLVEYFEI